jgi:hypothetical protein
MNTNEMIDFYNQFKADLLAGVISSYRTYVESRLPELTAEEMLDVIDDLEMMMQDDNTN